MAEQEAGWHNDPYGRFQQRYFNGTAWTEHVATGGNQQVDPMGASSVIPIATPATAFANDGKAAGVVKFLDAAGPDSRERPRPSLRAAVAGLGGAVLAIGLLVLTLGDNPSRGLEIAVSVAILAAAWALRTFVKFDEIRSAAVGMAVISIPATVAAITGDTGTSGFWSLFALAVLFIAAWALPGFKSRNLLLALGAIVLVSAFGSLTSPDHSAVDRCNQFLDEGNYDAYDAQCQNVYDDSSSSVLPTSFTDNVGDAGSIYLIGGALYLGLTFWLDRRGHRGTATAFAGAGLVTTLVGTIMLLDKFGDTSGALFVLAVGLVVALVGSHGARRATTWWGAVLTTIATVWFVAVQWEPDSSTAIGGVFLVAGLVLIAIPLVDDPIRAAMKARKSSGTTPEPPPPLTPAS